MALALLTGSGVFGFLRRRTRTRRRDAQGCLANPEPAAFVAYSKELIHNCLVVDCTHPFTTTVTHHKRCSNNVAGVEPSDCSTGLVLNLLRQANLPVNRAPRRRKLAPKCQVSPAILDALQMRNVSCDHFDADGLLSSWCWLHRDKALRHDKVLRATARIGDFREVTLPQFFPDDVAPAEAESDGVDADPETVLYALKLACWLNTQEVQRFSAPFVTKDSFAKYQHFLPLVENALKTLPPQEEWQEEFEQVMEGFRLVKELGSVEHCKDLGLAVVRAPEALHYYSLFSQSIGCDTVLTILPGQRYEVESKYTQYIRLHSRPVFPRLDFAPLAKALNAMETGDDDTLFWAAARITDTGPLLRLEKRGAKLSKYERYNHPCARTWYSSTIQEDVFERVVLSFFEFGLIATRGHMAPKLGGWNWEESHEYTKRVVWSEWEFAKS